MSLRKRTVLILLVLPTLGGCSSLGGAAGGLTGLVGSLLQTSLYLAAIAAPLYLSYYLYEKDNK